MFKNLINSSLQTEKYDEFYTPEYAVMPLLKYIPKHVKTIWCPCDTEQSVIVTVLRNAGYIVKATHIGEGKDFMDHVESCDMIITNPPFSLKDSFFKRAYALNIPFAFLLPINSLAGVSRGKLFRDKGISTVVLDNRVEYMGKNAVWFNTSWFIWYNDDSLDNHLYFEHIEKSKGYVDTIGLDKETTKFGNLWE